MRATCNERTTQRQSGYEWDAQGTRYDDEALALVAWLFLSEFVMMKAEFEVKIRHAPSSRWK